MTAALATASPADALPDAPTPAEKAQAKLLAALACPGTNTPVEIVAQETAAGVVRKGAIFAPGGERIGRIENFQVDFVRPGVGESLARLREGAAPRRIETEPEWRLVSHDDPRIASTTPAIVLSDPALVAFERRGCVIAFEARGPVEVLLFAHPWSGLVEVAALGETRKVDLYAPHTVIPRPLKLDLGPAAQRVEIRVTGAKNPLSDGHQCIFGGFRELTGREVPLRHVKQAKVRGAAFTSAFQHLLADVPEDGLLLDVGGGNRQIDDPRYINCDYAEYIEPDLVGDATMLPLRDASVDAVYSTGVFEHIVDPAKAGAEVARVLKPGGRAVIGWAFMQPIHSEGQHFYNATPWGVERAFSELKVKRMWYETSFAFLVRWGASVSGLAGRVPQEEIDAVCETLKKWDAQIPLTRKQYMANGVWAEFVKT